MFSLYGLFIVFIQEELDTLMSTEHNLLEGKEDLSEISLTKKN